MTLPDLFAPTFRDRSDQIALEWNRTVTTFHELDRRSRRLAAALRARGLRPGDRLAMYLPNRPEIVDLFLACAQTGIVLVPINILYRDREYGHILRDAAPAAVVLDGPPPVDTGAPLWPIDALVSDAATRDPDTAESTPADDDPALIIYTSGTTGAAKGAVLTQANVAANAATLVHAWRITAADRLLLALPLFHVHGLCNGIGCALAAGTRVRLLPRFDSTRAAAEFNDFGPTLFFGVPTMYVRLLEMSAEDARTIGARTRLFVSGSAPLPAAVFESFAARFGHRILERYGMSETLMTLGNPYDGERRPGTVGLPFPGVAIRLVDRTAADVVDGEMGELWVRSPTVFAGYWNKPAETAAAFTDCWFHTGDLASRDADGYITLLGRAHELIIAGGFNIYPREIEELLHEHEGIAEAAVVGVADPVRGETPVAFVVLRPGSPVDSSALDAYCRRHLASFKVPRAFVEVESLPRTALGKVQKRTLVERWQAR